MSHAVEKMVFAGETPWHGLGTEIDDTTSFWDAFKLAGLDWEVALEPIYRSNGDEVRAQVVVRQSDDKELGVVGPRWTPLQNREAFEVFEPLVESGDLILHTAGSLKGGERVWVLCQLGNKDNEVIVEGDEIAKFVLLSNGHDGKLAVHFGFTPIRVVCANTEAMARGSLASKLVRIRHHRFVAENVSHFREVMDIANNEFAATAEQYRFLASRQVHRGDLRKYVKTVLGVENTIDDKISSRTNNIIGKVEEFFLLGKGNDMAGVNGSYWAAYNGVTEYLNYEKGRSPETRMNSLWFGQNAGLSAVALETATAMATAS